MNESKAALPAPQETFHSAYLHFPFCESKCHYCDFFSFAESKMSQKTVANVYDAIASEVRGYAAQGITNFQTVFLGGGTPSLVPLHDLARAVEPLNLSTYAEVTLEANPSSISREKAEAWLKLGIKRVSMGLQALDDDRLAWLGRVHNIEQTYAALDALHEASMPSMSIDYILGVPLQSTATIKTELGELLDRYPNIRHVSAYLLTLKLSNSRFKELPTEDEQLDHLMAAHDTLTSRGFGHYEISNYSKPGFEALHNENYWLGGGYLGIGPSAHGYWPNKKMRTKNWSNLEKYIKDVREGRPPWEWTEAVATEQAELEFLMLRLRRAEGLSLVEYSFKFGKSLLLERRTQLEKARSEGLVMFDELRLKLTTRGLFLSDQIVNYII